MEHRSELERLIGLLATFVEVIKTIASDENPVVQIKLAMVAVELEQIAERILDIADASRPS